MNSATSILATSAEEQRQFFRRIALAFQGEGALPSGFGDVVDELEGSGRTILHLFADQLSGDAAFTLLTTFIGSYPDLFLKLLDQRES